MPGKKQLTMAEEFGGPSPRASMPNKCTFVGGRARVVKEALMMFGCSARSLSTSALARRIYARNGETAKDFAAGYCSHRYVQASGVTVESGAMVDVGDGCR